MNFAEVFPNDVPGISIEWEIYVGIDLILDTNPISITYFLMDLAELKELTAQLKDLLHKGFYKA